MPLLHAPLGEDQRGTFRVEKVQGMGQEEEEEEEQQDPLQEDHVDVTNFLHLFNRSVAHPLPPDF